MNTSNHSESLRPNRLVLEAPDGDKLILCAGKLTWYERALIEQIVTLRRDAEMALTGEWELSDAGFRAMVDAVDNVLASAPDQEYVKAALASVAPNTVTDTAEVA